MVRVYKDNGEFHDYFRFRCDDERSIQEIAQDIENRLEEYYAEISDEEEG